MRRLPLLLLLLPLGVVAATPEGADRIVLLPSEEEWTEEERADLAEALEALPPALRNFPGGPLELERHASEQPFGMGGWSKGRTRFHLHRRAPPSERLPELKLQDLSEAERDRLSRRR